MEVVLVNDDNDDADIITISSGMSSVEVSPQKDNQDHKSTCRHFRQRLKMHDIKVKTEDTDDSIEEMDVCQTLEIEPNSSDESDDLQEAQDTKQPRELLIEQIPLIEPCSQCEESQHVHFHKHGVNIPHAITLLLLANQDCICKSVPVNIRKSKCFLVDKTQLPNERDCTCDEMPWLKQRGQICKQYVIQEQFNKPYKLWPKGKKTQRMPKNCRILKVLKNMWVHSKVKGCKKTMISNEGNPLVFIQYTGLNNQPEIKLGKRKIRPSTCELVKDEVKNVKSTKRVVHNVRKKILESEGALPSPSKLPSYRQVSWIKEKGKKTKKAHLSTFATKWQRTRTHSSNVTMSVGI